MCIRDRNKLMLRQEGMKKCLESKKDRPKKKVIKKPKFVGSSNDVPSASETHTL